MVTTMKSATLTLRAKVPLASFAVPYAREFVESYPFPPPTTVYGLLLSFIGETNRFRYEGSQIAVLVLGVPTPSLILRKIRRFKDKEVTSKNNSKPDYVTLLEGLEFITCVRDSNLQGVPSLTQELKKAIHHPEKIQRFGGLSCGESHNLVDTLEICVPSDSDAQRGWVLGPAEFGEWTIPLWVDHVGSANTRWTTASFQQSTNGIQDSDFFIIASK